MSAFDGVAPLDGTLLVDAATLDDHAQDAGHVVTRRPAAVLRPGSVHDIAQMIRFCRERRIPVVARGLGNTTGGQSLVADGLVIDCRPLAGIAIGTDRATVGAGATWLELASAAHPHGLAVPAATGYLALTIGGTLSLGGVPPAFGAGGQIDHVLELEVVTGDGEVRRCSPDQDPDLFEAVLGGIGVFGVITEATVALVPAPARVRGYDLPYTDRAAFFTDYRTLIDRGEITEIYGDWWRPGEPAGLQHLNAYTYYDEAPDDAHVLRGLSSTPDAVRDVDYLGHVTRIDDAVDGLRPALDWGALVKPWLTLWLPATTAADVVGEMVDGLTPRDVGTGGFVLLYVQRRAALTRPSLRLPAPDGSDWVYLFTIMTAGRTPEADPGFGAAMLERNRELFERARAAGGVRYPIETVAFTTADWRAHYGDRWPHLQELRRRFDPYGVLGALFS